MYNRRSPSCRKADTSNEAMRMLFSTNNKTKIMITISDMLDIIAAGDGVYIKVQPADWVNGFSKPITAEELREKFPDKYSNDLAGFEKIDSYTYHPKFVTMQDEWDKELHDYISRKAEWCRKYGSD